MSIIEGYSVLGVIGLLCYGSREGRDERSVIWLGVGIMIMSGVLGMCGGWKEITELMKGIIYIIGGILVGSSISRGDVLVGRGKEYIGIILLITIGVGIIIGSKEIVMLYLGIELQALGLYMLVGWERESGYGTEGGMKYYIMGGVGSGIILIGSSIVYGELGAMDLREIGDILRVSRG